MNNGKGKGLLNDQAVGIYKLDHHTVLAEAAGFAADDPCSGVQLQAYGKFPAHNLPMIRGCTALGLQSGLVGFA